MSLNDKTLRLVFTGENDSGQAVQSVTRSLEDLQSAAASGEGSLDQYTRKLIESGRAARAQQRVQSLLRVEMYQSHEQFFMGARLVGQYGNMFLKANQVLTGFNVLQMRGEALAQDEGEAMMNLAKAVREYGANSDQAAKAAKRLNDVQKERKQFEEQKPLQYAIQGMSLLGMASEIGQLAMDTSLFFKYRRLGLFGRAGLGAGGFTPGSLSAVGRATGGGGQAAGALAGGGLAAVGGRLKKFAGSSVGKVVLPLAAGVGAYEFLTQTEEGKEINQFNPFKAIFDTIFKVTHSKEEVGQAIAQQAAQGGILGAQTGAPTGMAVGNVNVFVNNAKKEEVQAALEQEFMGWQQ